MTIKENIKEWSQNDMKLGIIPISIEERAISSYEGLDNEDQGQIAEIDFIEYYKKCYNEAVSRAREIIKTKVSLLLQVSYESVDVPDDHNRCEITGVVDESSLFEQVDDLEEYHFIIKEVLGSFELEDVVHKQLLNELTDLV